MAMHSRDVQSNIFCKRTNALSFAAGALIVLYTPIQRCRIFLYCSSNLILGNSTFFLIRLIYSVLCLVKYGLVR